MNWANSRGIEITPAQLDALAAYQQRVLDVNKYINLTAITDPADFAVKHFIDSLTLLPHLPHLPHKTNLIDIGTGAGFPGMVLRIMRDDLHITLLDSTRKRVNFLRETSEQLGLPTESVHARAEDFAREHGAIFDICTARAVAGMDRLAGWALPLVRSGGAFLAMKGPDVAEELEKA
ncbi:MAG: 16S rRNA (guanine(527)-N(7))-methyltransferase RsmG, partial [Defluviitaleaceae bacterium]|nr:16S rRNA (guanine(527)-N(7))-methyltransferase RsmG [Defluviitaleaceae bacterium]